MPKRSLVPAAVGQRLDQTTCIALRRHTPPMVISLQSYHHFLLWKMLVKHLIVQDQIIMSVQQQITVMPCLAELENFQS